MSELIEGQEYFSVDEAAEIIGWNRATVFEWVKALKMQKHKFLRNRKTYLEAGDVERLKEIKAKPWLAGEQPSEDKDALQPLLRGGSVVPQLVTA